MILSTIGWFYSTIYARELRCIWFEGWVEESRGLAQQMAFIHHQASLQLFIQFDPTTGCCGAQSLAEVFSTLTRMPGKHRISGEQAMLFLGSLRERLSLVALDGEEYAKALGAFASLGIVGGDIYDALLAQCALRAEAETIYSWNVRHYAQCGPEVTRRLQTP